jgi:hypothetical protein
LPGAGVGACGADAPRSRFIAVLFARRSSQEVSHEPPQCFVCLRSATGNTRKCEMRQATKGNAKCDWQAFADSPMSRKGEEGIRARGGVGAVTKLAGRQAGRQVDERTQSDETPPSKMCVLLVCTSASMRTRAGWARPSGVCNDNPADRFQACRQPGRQPASNMHYQAGEVYWM